MTDNESAPIAWPALLAKLREDPRAHALDFGYFMQRLRDRDATDPMTGPDFYDATDMLCRGTVMGQGAQMAKPVALLLDRAHAVAGADPGRMRNIDDLPLAALAAFCLAEALGQPVDAAEIDTVLAWLRAREDVSERSERRIAWASLAFGRAEGLYPFLLVDAAQQPPDPQTQEMRGAKNAQTFLARCALHDAGEALVLRGWRNYLDQFPLLLDTGRASWVELFWAGRAMYTAGLGRPAADLAGWLAAEVAAAGS
jgi:hypothetical protein